MASDRGVSGLQLQHNGLQGSTTGGSSQNSIREWLTTTITEEDAKHESLREAAEHLRRNPSGDDDLALGEEASLYGKQGVRTVQDFLRWSRTSPTISRWNSISSTTSGHSGPLSVMDILNLWKDDPEDFLLDLGFGCDEPDLSGRIPARFINYQSQARGINLQVFLEAQKSRMDLENPDVSNRFRQLEVLQQVTTAFSSLVGSSSFPLKAPLEKDLPPEARERRRRMGMLFRRASKKSLSQMHSQKALDLSTPDITSSACAAPESLRTPPSLGDKKVPLKRLKPGQLETVSLSPLAEELGAGQEPQAQSHVVSFVTQEATLKAGALKEGHPLTATSLLQRKKNQWQAKESFEMEEIHSFDEGSVTGSNPGGAENIVRGLIRTNSCQSDSSGFLEEPFVPSLPQQGSPAPDLIKALAGLSGGSTDSHSSEKPGSPPPLYPHTSTSPLSLETETLLQDGHSLPASLLQTDSQSPSLASRDIYTHLPSSCPHMQTVSLIKETDKIETDHKDAPCHLSDSEPAAYNTSVLPSVTSPSPSPNCDSPLPASIALSSESSSWSTGNKLSKGTEELSNTMPNLASSGLSSLLLSSPHLRPTGPSDFHSSQLTDSCSHSPTYSQKDSPSSDSKQVGLSETPTKTPCSFSFQSHKDKPSTPSPLSLDSSKFEDGCPTLPCPSPKRSTPVCPSELSSQNPDNPIDPPAEKVSDLSQPSNTDPAPTSAVQDVIHVKMDHVSLHLEDTLQRKGKGEVEDERHRDTEQTRETDVYIPDTESSLGLPDCSRLVSEELSNQTDPQIHQVPCHCLNNVLSAETRQEGLREVCKAELKNTGSDWSVRSSVLHKEVAEESRCIKADSKDLIEIESLDIVFETSVDGSDYENGEGDAFFRQLDTEGQVFWAEPVQICYSPQLLEELGSFEAFDGSPEKSDLPKDPGASFSPVDIDMPLNATSLLTSQTVGTDLTLKPSTDCMDTLSLLTPCPALSTSTDLKPLSRSVSVQMFSSPSSHIVHRKDVPYVTDSKPTLPCPILPLDTSSPFRAVQSWTDLRMQRQKNLSHEILDTVPNEVAFFTRAPETIQRPAQMFSSTPSFPLQSNDWLSPDFLAGKARNYRTVSVSVDTGLSPHNNRNENKEGKKLWEDHQTTTVNCCCSCDRQCTCCSQKGPKKQQSLETIPFSLDELEEMMLCLQQFCSVLSNMEEQLSEDQAAVYSCLSDQDRENVRDIEKLRQAVKREAGELEKQLNDLAHHYDDSLKMKMHRLLDEQTLLCSQLRVFLPGASNPSSNRTVATQCSSMPWIAAGHTQSDHLSSWSTWKENSPRGIPPGLDNICESLGSSPTKADKMDIVGFLQRLKESLHHSVNTDSLE